jgi:hypothetical protein
MLCLASSTASSIRGAKVLSVECTQATRWTKRAPAKPAAYTHPIQRRTRLIATITAPRMRGAPIAIPTEVRWHEPVGV